MNESYLKGNFTGGYYLYGYDIIDKKCVVNPDEAAIVYEVFTGYADGYTVPAIVANLRFRGITDKRGKFFTTSAIYKMLGNQKYNGKVMYRGVLYDNLRYLVGNGRGADLYTRISFVDACCCYYSYSACHSWNCQG